jgi:hypothetical protein
MHHPAQQLATACPAAPEAGRLGAAGRVHLAAHQVTDIAVRRRLAAVAGVAVGAVDVKRQRAEASRPAGPAVQSQGNEL